MNGRPAGYVHTLPAFVIGLIIGGSAIGLAAQPNRIPGNNGVNHVGINVVNMNEAIAYYTKTLGFGEAAIIRDDKGQHTVAFIQVNRNTFIELVPAAAERPPGVNHFGLHVDDLKATTAALRQRGVKNDDPRVGRTISFVTSVTDSSGARMELSEIGPESMLGKAIASWK